MELFWFYSSQIYCCKVCFLGIKKWCYK